MHDVLSEDDRFHVEQLRHSYAIDDMVKMNLPAIFKAIDKLAPWLPCPFCGSPPEESKFLDVQCSNTACPLHDVAIKAPLWQKRFGS